MAKAKQLWNTSGVLKSFTDTSGTYQVIRPWDEAHGGGGVEVEEADVKRLMDNGFTDQNPSPKSEPAPKPKKKKASAPKPPAEEGG